MRPEVNGLFLIASWGKILFQKEQVWRNWIITLIGDQNYYHQQGQIDGPCVPAYRCDILGTQLRTCTRMKSGGNIRQTRNEEHSIKQKVVRLSVSKNTKKG